VRTSFYQGWRASCKPGASGRSPPPRRAPSRAHREPVSPGPQRKRNGADAADLQPLLRSSEHGGLAGTGHAGGDGITSPRGRPS